MRHSHSAHGGRRHGTKLCILLVGIVVTVLGDDSGAPPTPDVVLKDLFPRTNFHQALFAMWEPDHAGVSQDESSVTLMLDQNSGCGIKSIDNFYHGFFSASIKLPGNYSAGVVTTFYMSNNQAFPDTHDEMDFEFLGTIPGEPYTIQTNIYSNGKTKVGREQRFRLWFDPTEDFHDYSFLWNTNHTVFFVDSTPIWEFPNLEGMGNAYPSKEMALFGTIWDASRWATDGGRYKVDYAFQPFVATYSDFIVTGCSQFDSSNSADSCPPIFNDKIPPGLTKTQLNALQWVQANHRFYSYCTDTDRYPDTSLIPECESERSHSLSSMKKKAKPAYLEETFIHIPVQSELLIHP
ncbi:unnamed protein product [Calypogeia fissa]